MAYAHTKRSNQTPRDPSIAPAVDVTQETQLSSTLQTPRFYTLIAVVYHGNTEQYLSIDCTVCLQQISCKEGCQLCLLNMFFAGFNYYLCNGSSSTSSTSSSIGIVSNPCKHMNTHMLLGWVHVIFHADRPMLHLQDVTRLHPQTCMP